MFSMLPCCSWFQMKNVRVHLSMPKKHPMSDLVETKTNNQLMYLNFWTIDGKTTTCASSGCQIVSESISCTVHL